MHIHIQLSHFEIVSASFIELHIGLSILSFVLFRAEWLLKIAYSDTSSQAIL